MSKSRFGLLNQVESISLEVKKRMVKKCNNEKASKAGNYPSNIKDFVYDPNNDPTIIDDGEKQYAYGVLIDFTEGKSSPDLVRIGNMELHRTLPVQSQYKGCIWDFMNKKILYYLNPENWNLAVNDEIHNVQKTAEEVAQDMRDYEKDIRVETPKFYASSKVLATDGAGHTIMAKVMFSTIKLNASYIEIPRQITSFRDVRFVGANGATFNSNLDTVESIGGNCTTKNDPSSGVNDMLYPITNIDRATARDYAHNSNSHLVCYEYYKWIFYWAFVIEYATFKYNKPIINELDENGFHQGGLGGGLTLLVEPNGINPRDTTGKDKCRYIGVTNELGNRTGELNIPTDTGLTKIGHPNRYRGFECPFGDIRLNLDGIIAYTISNNDDEPIYHSLCVCNNPLYFKDEISKGNSDVDVSSSIDFEIGGWREAFRYYGENYNSNNVFDGDSIFDYTIKFSNIGIYGDLFPQDAEINDNEYFCGYFHITSGIQSIEYKYGFIVGTNYSNTGGNIGLHNFMENLISFASKDVGYKCFNIIKDDGTVI